jgi:hypothetical protein
VEYSYRKSRIEVKIKEAFKKLKRYGNFFIFILTLLVTYLLVKNQEYISSLRVYGYIGGFISGMLIPFGWVAIPAFTTLFMLGKGLDTWTLTFTGTSGALMSNLFLLYWSRSLLKNMEFLKKVRKEIWLFFVRSHFRNVVKSRYSHYIVPALASFIFASPLPNQWGITLLSLSEYETWKIILFVILFSFLEVFFTVNLGKILQ